MAENTEISWTHFPREDGSFMDGHSANLWWGCTEVHEGCKNCYAETLSKRFGDDIWGNDKPRKAILSFWKDLRKFQRTAAAANEIHRVFVGSMMDIFEKPMPVIDSKGEKILDDMDEEGMDTGDMRNAFFHGIDRGEYPNLMFLLLTKRPSNINKYIPQSWKTNPPVNVMFGTSPVDQETADKLIPQLLQVNGKRFLSIEPLLGPIDLREYGWLSGCDACCNGDRCPGPPECTRYNRRNCPVCNGTGKGNNIHWVIVGGESGHNARPMHPHWVRSIRVQCENAKVPFLFKQWGEWVSIDMPSVQQVITPLAQNERWMNIEGGHGFHGDKVYRMRKVGKKTAGNLLDGKTYLNFPK